MTIRLLTIPDEPSQWADWLEQQLVGLHLHELIEELRMAPPVIGASAKPLQEIVKPDVLVIIEQQGLKTVPFAVVQQLLISPDALSELQDRVLEHGGTYWQSIPAEPELQQAVDRVWKGVISRNQQTSQLPQVPADSVRRPVTRSAFPLRWIAAMAALVLVSVFLWQSQPHASGRILGSPGLTASNVPSADEYFDRYADAGEQWFDQHPRDSAELIVLLREVSSDCQILIDAKHDLLNDTERNWFLTKCRNWKKEFDSTLAALESNSLTFESARLEADKTMMKLVNALRAGPAA